MSEKELNIAWGGFIEHKPYFRLMPDGDWKALKSFVSNLLSVQKSEMLKRVPSVSEIAYSIFKAIKESVGSDSISKAVHKLVKDKLK